MSSFDISKYTGAAVLLSLQKFCKLIDAASSCANYFRLLLITSVVCLAKHINPIVMRKQMSEHSASCVGKLCLFLQ